ncbi:hypothetical protein GCM10010532_006890 [Dactylosporangium siamense]
MGVGCLRRGRYHGSGPGGGSAGTRHPLTAVGVGCLRRGRYHGSGPGGRGAGARHLLTVALPAVVAWGRAGQGWWAVALTFSAAAATEPRVVAARLVCSNSDASTSR